MAYSPYCSQHLNGDGSLFCFYLEDIHSMTNDIQSAEEICTSKGYTLLKLYNSQISDLYLRAIKSWNTTDKRTDGYYVRMGLSRNDNNRTWMWNDGKPMEFPKWEWESNFDCGFVEYRAEPTAPQAVAYVAGVVVSIVVKNANFLFYSNNQVTFPNSSHYDSDIFSNNNNNNNNNVYTSNNNINNNFGFLNQYDHDINIKDSSNKYDYDDNNNNINNKISKLPYYGKVELHTEDDTPAIFANNASKNQH
ncbi:hypothetical protein HELRODRAFT_182583 [Helobdella robusta]|uniref:C-type lectin domain-containing protein n=1 Tax=Helobdella robusta TaxID=6412 RepID=T1FIE6_HELRO|nr:hypothetical protein HELRODRAFT_182583 [Helobdella robusta]ESN90874.1 hypothetical protein HELRODRAFT_182583 [Helobdella robusta]